MATLILSTATRYLMPLLLLLSVHLLLRGHNEPGGGFVGGLVASAAFALYTIAHGVDQTKRMLRVDSKTLIVMGLFLALASGTFSLFAGDPFMTGLWMKEKLPTIGKVGTPVLFDAGVYCVVVGVTLTILFALAED